MATQELRALQRAPIDAVSSDELWRRVELAVRSGDQVMAEVHLRSWLAAASTLVDQACDLILERERPSRGRSAG